jgi:hypothetical protein
MQVFCRVGEPAVMAALSQLYAARAVEAAPLRVGDQQEKFLFYRGVGNFALSISARTLENGAVAVDNLTDDALDWLIFFEKRGRKIGYHIYGGLRARQRLTIETPTEMRFVYAPRSKGG